MSGCACIYGGDGENGPDFETTRWIVARRPHRCQECRESIPVGARYERTTGKWDGRMATMRTCAACAEIRGALFCEGWTYGQVWEDIGEHVANVGAGSIHGCINELTTEAAKRKLQAWFIDQQEIPS